MSSTPHRTAGSAADPLRIGELGTFAASCALDDIPAPVQDFGRILLLDSLGALLGGLRYPPVRALGSALEHSTDQSVPVGRLLTWGTAATWLDADSGGSFHPAGGRIPPVPTAHPAPHVLPALLHSLTRPGGSAEPVPDAEVVRTFVIATEIGMRFGVGTSLRLGLHPHGIHGPISAAVATALRGGADAATVSAAIALAAGLPMAATLAVPMHGGTVRNIWTGFGAYHGALAAGRALAGVSGDTAGPAVLYDGVVCTDPDIGLISGELGRRWEIGNSYLKPYACARWIHPALDALGTALDIAGHPDPAVITAIEIDTFAFAASLDSLGDDSDMHARFSVPRCAATLAFDGRLDAGGFLPEALARPAVGDLARKVRLREEPAFTAALPRERPTRVTVRWADRGGIEQAATAQVRNARGNPDDPLTIDEVVDKFRHNIGDLVPPEVVDRTIRSLTGPPGQHAALTDLARAIAELPAPQPVST